MKAHAVYVFRKVRCGRETVPIWVWEVTELGAFKVDSPALFRVVVSAICLYVYEKPLRAICPVNILYLLLHTLRFDLDATSPEVVQVAPKLFRLDSDRGLSEIHGIH